MCLELGIGPPRRPLASDLHGVRIHRRRYRRHTRNIVRRCAVRAHWGRRIAVVGGLVMVGRGRVLGGAPVRANFRPTAAGHLGVAETRSGRPSRSLNRGASQLFTALKLRFSHGRCEALRGLCRTPERRGAGQVTIQLLRLVQTFCSLASSRKGIHERSSPSLESRLSPRPPTHPPTFPPPPSPH